MSNKAQFNVGFILALILAIVFLVFFLSGGGIAIFNIANTLSKIPGFVWVFLGLLILIKLLLGKR